MDGQTETSLCSDYGTGLEIKTVTELHTSVVLRLSGALWPETCDVMIRIDLNSQLTSQQPITVQTELIFTDVRHMTHVSQD